MQKLMVISNWFTEGLDTKDLQEAKVLLDSLASSVEKVESHKPLTPTTQQD